MSVDIDLEHLATREEFARELTFLKDRAGLTIRKISKLCGRSDATIGDYFSGAHLPRPEALPLLLEALGVVDTDAVDQWMRAITRVRTSTRKRIQTRPEPYRGLAPYQTADAEWFCGRDQLVDLVISRLIDQHTAGNRLLIVVGPSGSGKSSLLRAGLIPHLRTHGIGVTGSNEWPVLLMTPGDHPNDVLAAKFDGTNNGPCVLVVDQFEEIFTSCQNVAERHSFIDLLCGTTSTAETAENRPVDTLVVVGLRADFYAQALGFPQFARAAQQAQVVVEPMSRTELISAIVEPARKAGVTVEDGLVEVMLRDLVPADRTPAPAYDTGALPLLSHALLATWRESGGQEMTLASYRSCGGISGAVTRTAEEVVGGLADVRKDLARRLFLRLVHVGDEAVTRRRTLREDLLDSADPNGADLTDLLDELIDARLVTANHDTVEIAHEALVWAWPQLRSWIETDRTGLRAAQQLTDAAHQWQQEGRGSEALYRGGRLAAIRDWVESGGRVELPPVAAEFYDQSIVMQGRWLRRVYAVISAFAALALVATLATVVAYQQRGAVARERDLALSRATAIQADRVRGTDVALAAQLSLAAYRIAPTTDALSSLLNTSANPTVTRILGPTGVVHAVAIGPDRETLAVGSADRSVRLWGIRSPHQPRGLAPPVEAATGPVTTIAFSPDGHTLAAGSADHTVRLFDVTVPDQIHSLGLALTGPSDVINSVAFSPDGSTLAAGSTDGSVWRWVVADPQRPAALGAPLISPAAVQAVAFNATSSVLAAGTADGTVRRWSRATGAVPIPEAPLQTGTGRAVNAVAFSPDGSSIAAGGNDNTIHRWVVAGTRQPTTVLPQLTGPASWVYAIAFSPDGKQLAAGSADDAVRVWDLATSAVTATLPHPGPVTAVAYVGDSHTLASGAADGTTRIWTLPTPILTSAASSVFTVAFSPDASTLAVAAGDGSIHRWNLTDPWQPMPMSPRLTAPAGQSPLDGTLAYGAGPLLAAGDADGGVQLWVHDDLRPVSLRPPPNGFTGAVQYVIFSPDGRTVAAGNDQGGVQLWDITDPGRPRPQATLVAVHGSAIYSVAFSPDASILAGASADNTVWLWDMSSRDHPRPLSPPLTGPTNAVYHVAFSPNGRILAAGSADGSVHLWDMSNRGPVSLGPPLTGPQGYVYAVAFTPDGHTLATANTDKTVWLWNLSDPQRPQRLAVLTGFAKTVFSVAISPDGTVLAAGGQDRTVRLWHTESQDVATHVCATAGAEITVSEWRQNIGETPYRPPC